LPDCLIRFHEFAAPEALRGLGTGVPRGAANPRAATSLLLRAAEHGGARSRRPDVGQGGDVSYSGAHVLLELDTRPPRLIPYIREFVPTVNLEEGWLICTYPLDDCEERP
jgi:hypothetical protein